MAFPPPQYPVYPYPPAGHPYGPPPPARMPGLTTTSVVLLWVMAGFGGLNALVVIPMAVFLPDLFEAAFPNLGPWMPALVAVTFSQALAWAMLRGFLAVKIARRSARARRAAIVVESIGMAFQVALAVVMFSALAADPPDGGFRYSFDCTGIVLPILVLCFLTTARSRQWCDR